MKLTDLIDVINSIEEDDELCIFQEDTGDYTADIILAKPVDGDAGVKVENGRRYVYLIEVFLANEFIDDWLANPALGTDKEKIAKRLYEYGINDA